MSTPVTGTVHPAAAAGRDVAASAPAAGRDVAASAPAAGRDAAASAEPTVSPRFAFRPPPWLDRALEAAIVAAKAATVVCAIDAIVNADTPRLAGKGLRTRAIGYVAGLAVVPVIWRALPDHGRYPRGLDLAVTLPLLIDATGNSLGLYNEAHLDDVVHFLNAAIVSGVAGALFATRTDDAWQAAIAGTTTAIAGESVWEIAEFVAMKAGAEGMGLTYQDTIADIADSAVGAIVGGIVTWLRMPREKEERSRGWRHAVAGWRDTGEPVSIVGGRGSIADRAVRRTTAAAR